MDESQWTVLENERLSMADMLAGLRAEQWEQPSLCERWRVRDVAAHVAMTPTAPSVPVLVSALVRARGNLWEAGARIAIDHAARPTEAIVAQLRSDAAARTMPVITNAENLLMDAVIQGQDIAVPLGIDRPVPPDAARMAFERVWAMGWPFHARRRLQGVRLEATDVDVVVGDGPVVTGRAVDLLLLMTGRTAAALPRLTGPGIGLLPA